MGIIVSLTTLALAGGLNMTTVSALALFPPGESSSQFPTVPAEHRHVRALLDNAMLYVAPKNGMIDPISGYPFEGWNQDPKRGLFLRSFTQLTAIGQLMELLAVVVAGEADTPSLTREQALTHLIRLVRSLREDQRDPRLSAKGLLGNFLDLATGKRLGPLASDVDKHLFLDAFGAVKGEAIWKTLQAKGWIIARNDDREAAIQRNDTYGAEHFDGMLALYGDAPTKSKIMQILDQRVVMSVFGDNANLSASAAKTIGALLLPAIKDKPEVIALRRDLERFLDDQKAGYTHLYDPKAGLFDFGWNATKDRLFGWEDPQGKWKTGHMDYLVNEFRGPASFIVLRYGLPVDAIGNLGFKMKPYKTRDDRELYTLAPWEGSAFQALGLGLMLNETSRPSWRTLLGNVVDIEVDFASRQKLPGFLSESYTGEGVEYTGKVGIPEITVSPRPRVTDAGSLYPLGAANTVAPAKIEQFLAANWTLISTLLTDHGPWEGYNATTHQPIRFQTSAHSLSLILGLIGTGSEHMKRYLDSKGLSGRLADFYKTGETVDLLSDASRAVAWTDKEHAVQSSREAGAFRVTGDSLKEFGIAFIPVSPRGVNLSGGLLSLRYRSTGPIEPAQIELKPTGGAPGQGDLISREISVRFAATGDQDREIQVPLPATPGLSKIKEVVISHGQGTNARSIDLTITRFGITPIASSQRAGD